MSNQPPGQSCIHTPQGPLTLHLNHPEESFKEVFSPTLHERKRHYLNLSWHMAETYTTTRMPTTRQNFENFLLLILCFQITMTPIHWVIPQSTFLSSNARKNKWILQGPLRVVKSGLFCAMGGRTFQSDRALMKNALSAALSLLNQGRSSITVSADCNCGNVFWG